MVKTNERYGDGSIVYLHDCSQCGEVDCARGTKNKTTSKCSECLRLNMVENVKKNKPSTKHGLRYHPLYERWKLMKARCYNKNNPRYSDWGGRGIKVCDEWINDAKAYIEYLESLDNCLSEDYSVDRIDNDGDYKPGNLRWATYSEQSLNQRRRKRGITSLSS